MRGKKASEPGRQPYPDPADPAVWRVPLSDGGYALIDEEDVCRVDEHCWQRKHCRKTDYAQASIVRGGIQVHVAMHRHLFGLDVGDRIEIDHRNHDGLDNRRSNLRLATSRQNSNNRRKLKPATSKHKGVAWSEREGFWIAGAYLISPGRTLRIALGRYASEGEAAYAFHVAGPLLKDPDFLHLEPIPPEMMPTAARQAEIREIVIAKVKARLAGRKGDAAATSRHSGVSHNPTTFPGRPWQVIITVEGKRTYLGYYADENEAALAYNIALEHYADHRRPPNEIPADALSPEAAASVRQYVEARLARPTRQFRDWSWLTPARYESLCAEHGSPSAVADHLGVRVDYLKTIVRRATNAGATAT